MRKKVCYVSVATLTYWGEGADKCCWASVRWFFISQTPEPNHISNPRKKNQNEASQGSLRALLSFQLGDVRGHPRITSHQAKQQNNKTTKHPIIGTKRSAEIAETYDYPFCVGTDYSLVHPLLFWCGFCLEKTQGNSLLLLSRSPVPAEVTQQ